MRAMKRALLLLTILMPLFAACGDDSADATDMAVCPVTTCATSSQFFNPKTCTCDDRDMAVAPHD